MRRGVANRPGKRRYRKASPERITVGEERRVCVLKGEMKGYGSAPSWHNPRHGLQKVFPSLIDSSRRTSNLRQSTQKNKTACDWKERELQKWHLESIRKKRERNGKIVLIVFRVTETTGKATKEEITKEIRVYRRQKWPEKQT